MGLRRLMPYTPVPIDSFGGLVLADDPQQVPVGNAVDILNTDPSVRGKLRARPGSSQLVALAGVGNITTLTPWTLFNGNKYLVATQGASGIKVVDNSGNLTASDTDITTSVVTHGNTALTNAYYAKPGLGIGRINDLFAFADVTAAPFATYLAVTPLDSRLVAAEGIQVNFSNPGDGENFDANDYVLLDPGDGEDITGMVTWSDRLFVFKKTKFYVFYGTSTSSTGTPIFNYRTVKNTVGVMDLPQAACAAVDGVYFLAPSGIYRTTGDTPVKVSGEIDAWFAGQLDPLAVNVPPVTATPRTIAADAHRLYFATSQGTFVRDLSTGQWTVWSPAIRAMTVGSLDGTTYPTYFAVGATINELDPALTTDNGVGFNWTYRSGVTDLGVSEEKVIRGAQVWGTGIPTIRLFSDHSTADAGAEVLELGTAPGVAAALHLYSREGTFFSLGLNGGPGDIINRVVVNVRDRRPVSVG